MWVNWTVKSIAFSSLRFAAAAQALCIIRDSSMLIEKQLADLFLSQYKKVMSVLNNGIFPDSIKGYASLRADIFYDINATEKAVVDFVDPEFITILKFTNRWQRYPKITVPIFEIASD